jgi:hypothetical protein
MGTGLSKDSISSNSWYGSLSAEKTRRRSQNQCAKKCNSWMYHCYPCLENSPWLIILFTQHLTNASPHSSWSLCKGGVLPLASCKMLYKHRVYCKHPIYWWGVNFQNTHVWEDDNPYTTGASRHQRRYSINVCVGNLGDELLDRVASSTD